MKIEFMEQINKLYELIEALNNDYPDEYSEYFLGMRNKKPWVQE